MSSPVLELNNLDIFQHDNLVLHHVNLTMYEGDYYYLVGKTGTGKSSLLKTLYGALPLQVGEAQVAGFQLKDLKQKQIPHLRRALGIVFQDFQLLTDRTVEENLDFVLKATGWKDSAKRKNRIDEVLNDVGIQSKGYKMPFQLSGGEQQRVVIARALLNQPNLILADEPTGNLDPETSIEIISLLKRLNEELNTAILIATHDYNIIEQFPAKIIRCKDESLLLESSNQLH